MVAAAGIGHVDSWGAAGAHDAVHDVLHVGVPSPTSPVELKSQVPFPRLPGAALLFLAGHAGLTGLAALDLRREGGSRGKKMSSAVGRAARG
jgi:hypothetical protein